MGNAGQCQVISISSFEGGQVISISPFEGGQGDVTMFCGYAALPAEALAEAGSA
jgi:hypothetical protein